MLQKMLDSFSLCTVAGHFHSEFHKYIVLKALSLTAYPKPIYGHFVLPTNEWGVPAVNYELAG